MMNLNIDSRILRILPFIVLLLTPLLVAATPIYPGQILPNPWIWEILENLGRFLSDSPIGQIIITFRDAVIHTVDGGREIILKGENAIIDWISCNGSHAVIQDPGDPLYGYLDGCTGKIGDTICQIVKPRMYRPRVDAQWELAKDFQNWCQKT